MGTTRQREDSTTQEHPVQASSDPQRGDATLKTDALEYTAHTVSELEQQWRGVLETITQYTRTQPWPALAMAAGLGLLIGRRLTAPRAGRRDVMSHTSGLWPPRMDSPS